MLRERTRSQAPSLVTLIRCSKGGCRLVEKLADEQFNVDAMKANVQAAEAMLLLAKNKERLENIESRNKYLRVVKQVRLCDDSKFWKRGQKSARVLEFETGYRRTTLRRDAAKLLSGDDILKGKGRQESSSSSLAFIEEYQTFASDRDMRQNSFRKIAGGSRNIGRIGGYDAREQVNTQFKFTNDQHRAFIIRNNENPTCEQLKDLSEYLIGKAEKKIFSEETSALKEDRQNKRRLQANSDGYNSLSLAAILDVMFCMENVEDLSNVELETLLEKLGK